MFPIRREIAGCRERDQREHHAHLELPRFGYISDLLYFPVPEQGVVGGPFRLYFKTPELQEAVVVSFEIGQAMKP